jgi:hypothetical protein
MALADITSLDAVLMGTASVAYIKRNLAEKVAELEGLDGFDRPRPLPYPHDIILSLDPLD